MELLPGTLLQGGKYKIIRFINAGGFGCTYEGEHIMLHKRIAIKEFFVKDFCNRDEQTSQVSVGIQNKVNLVEKLRKKFIEEAVALSHFTHPNIVSVSDVFEENGTAYYVMDFIDGESLLQIVNKQGALSESEATRYIIEIAHALNYVHGLNRLHLDIKPGNIMIGRDGHAKLIDFGASKQYDEVDGENTSTLLGKTPGYAPIEQMGNRVQTFSAATDIYSLGATFYKLITGVTPADSTEIAEDEDALLPLPSTVSSNIASTIIKSMEVSRKRRQQSISEFLSLLVDYNHTDVSEMSRNTQNSVSKRQEQESSELINSSKEWIDKDETLVCEDLYDNINEVDLGLSVKWHKFNLGARTEHEVGIYCGWADNSAVHIESNLDLYPSSTPPCSIVGDVQFDISTNRLGGDWRLPTLKEFEELKNCCSWRWCSEEDHIGYEVLGPNGNSIFLPAAGLRTESEVKYENLSGNYWSGDLQLKNSDEAYALYFDNNTLVLRGTRRYFGFSIRPVKK